MNSNDSEQATPSSPQPPAHVGLLTTEQAGGRLGLAPATLDNDRCDGRLGVPFVRMGRAIRYRPIDLDAWVSARVVRPAKVAAQ